VFKFFIMVKRNSADSKIIPIANFVSTYFPDTYYKVLLLRGLLSHSNKASSSKNLHDVSPSVYSRRQAQLRMEIITILKP